MRQGRERSEEINIFVEASTPIIRIAREGIAWKPEKEVRSPNLM